MDCLDCEDYAVCGTCAPGWDVGCIAEEWHQAGESDKPAFKINNDGTLNITNQTTYELGTSCQSCDQCADEGSLTDQFGHTGTPIPFMINNECVWLPIFGVAMIGDCVTGQYGFEGGKVKSWKVDPVYGLTANFSLTDGTANWRDVLDCSNMNLTTRESGEGPDNSTTYPDPISWNINIDNASNAICYNSTFSTDCDWQDGRACSDKLWGVCGNDAAKCPSALHCGPQACNMTEEPYCIQIEIFKANCVPTT